MCFQLTCNSCVMLLCQHWPRPLTNVSSSLLNQSKPGTRRAYLSNQSNYWSVQSVITCALFFLFHFLFPGLTCSDSTCPQLLGCSFVVGAFCFINGLCFLLLVSSSCRPDIFIILMNIHAYMAQRLTVLLQVKKCAVSRSFRWFMKLVSILWLCAGILKYTVHLRLTAVWHRANPAP